MLGADERVDSGKRARGWAPAGGVEVEGYGGVWVEGPWVKGLHDPIPTQVAALHLRQGSGGGGGEGKFGGCLGSEGAGLGEEEAKHWVAEEATVLRELVFYYLRNGGDLVGEYVGAGGAVGQLAIVKGKSSSAESLCVFH